MEKLQTPLAFTFVLFLIIACTYLDYQDYMIGM